jgi:secondary thiamine-phosphate synthase enzyme
MQFTIKTTKREEIIDITSQVQTIVSRFSVREGTCNVFIPHATAAVTINENCDEKVNEDFLEALGKIAPQGAWKHDKVDGNGDAHVKAAIIKPNITIPIQNNRLLLGRWQGIMFCEFDGPKERTVIVNVNLSSNR